MGNASTFDPLTGAFTQREVADGPPEPVYDAAEWSGGFVLGEPSDATFDLNGPAPDFTVVQVASNNGEKLHIKTAGVYVVSAMFNWGLTNDAAGELSGQIVLPGTNFGPTFQLPPPPGPLGNRDFFATLTAPPHAIPENNNAGANSVRFVAFDQWDDGSAVSGSCTVRIVKIG